MNKKDKKALWISLTIVFIALISWPLWFLVVGESEEQENRRVSTQLEEFRRIGDLKTTLKLGRPKLVLWIDGPPDDVKKFPDGSEMHKFETESIYVNHSYGVGLDEKVAICAIALYLIPDRLLQGCLEEISYYYQGRGYALIKADYAEFRFKLKEVLVAISVKKDKQGSNTIVITLEGFRDMTK